jgi:segregation and condensation protein A
MQARNWMLRLLLPENRTRVWREIRHESAVDYEEDRATTDPVLLIDTEGFSGPLDLLLELARRQKVDLAKISILQLVEQYLSFIERARTLRLELAADYLVMAAWLAYLKSRLLVPAPESSAEPDAADLAAALANKLKRLEAFRGLARMLQDRPQLDRDMFGRGQPEPVAMRKIPIFDASIHDLLNSYAQQRQTRVLSRISLHKRVVWSLDEARAALERLVGVSKEWAALDEYLIAFITEPEQRRTVRATALSASLELVKEGRADLRQDAAFAPIYLRARAPSEPRLQN